MTAPLRAGLLLATASLFSLQAEAQTAGQGPDPRNQTPERAVPTAGGAADDLAEGADEDIVVTGQRPRGSVAGDIKPELTFNSGDVRSLGVSTINDLLAELGPQLTSARGGQPVVLLEGRRVSSFREIATIPAEAIQRVEILPEEVGLKYGYSANQKVMNIVLRRRFRAVTAEGRDRLSTDGGGNQLEGQLGFLGIRRDTRINLNADYEGTAALREIQRGITTPTGGDTLRTLAPSERQLTIGGTYARNLSSKVGASLNAEAVIDRTRALIGASTVPGIDAFERNVRDKSLHLGGTLNAEAGTWRGTLTATYDHAEGRTITLRGLPADVARSSSDIGTIDLTANTSLYRLPAGDISLTGHLGGTVSGFRSESVRSMLFQSADLSRSIGLGSLSLDVPILESPSPFVGRLSANGNVEVQTLSDFGEVVTYGFGLNWAPRRNVTLIGSYSHADQAPTIQQLGNPQIVTPLTPVFDFNSGQSVLVTRVSGGNPALAKGAQRDWRLGLNVKPFTNPDLTFSVDYNDRHIENGVSALPGLTLDTERAFPSRFVRDANGDLLRIDTTPVNIAEQDSRTLRWGVNFTKRLKTPQAQIDAFRAAFQRRQAEGGPPPGGPGGPGGPDGERRAGDGVGAGAGRGAGAPGGDPGARGGPRGFGGPGGPGGGGRLNVALYHTWHLTETAVLQDGQPMIDLLRGGTIGDRAGSPRHEVEVQAGYSQSGIGVRLTGSWQSATHILNAGGAAGDLRFSSLATVNARLFANLSQIPGFIGKYPWMRGMRVSLAVTNLFNQRQDVTDATGATPFAYQKGYIDPLGRTVSISVRKLFF